MSSLPSPTAHAETASHDDASLWSRLRSKLRPPRLLSLTRAGKFFILMTLGIGFAAINTENNLLFLLFGMKLSVILASGVLSEAVLRNLRLRRRLPRRIEAGQPAPGAFTIENQGWWPALSVEASEQNPRCIRGPRAGQRIGPRPISWWKFWRRQTDAERRPVAATYALRIASADETQLTAHYELPYRGEYVLKGLQLKTRFPFSLFEKTRRFEAPTRLTVLPAALPADQWLGKLDSRWGETRQNERGRGEEYFGLRDYRPGEDQRAIHWKSTARRGEPMVRETEARQRQALVVVFDNRAPTQAPTSAHHALFEQGVRHLAGLIHTLHRQGFRLQLITGDGQVAPDLTGEIEPLLRHLATIALGQSTDPPPPSEDRNDRHGRPMTSRIRIGFRSLLSGANTDDTLLALDELSDTSA